MQLLLATVCELFRALNCSSSLILISAALVLFVVHKFLRDRGLPPGPWGLPIVGFLPFLGESPFVTFQELTKAYGDVFTITLLGRNFVIVNGHQAIKEALVGNNSFNDKPREFFYFSASVKNNGVAALNGESWREQRKFVMSKMFTMSVMSGLGPKLAVIGKDLVEFLNKTRAEPTDLREAFANCSSNSVSQILYSKNYSWDDPKFVKLRSAVVEFVHSMSGPVLFLAGPYFEMAMKLFLKKKHDNFLGIAEKCTATMMTVVQDRIDEGVGNEDFLDAFLKKHEEELESDVPEKERQWSLQRLSHTLFTMFQAGTDTTSETLYHGFYLLAKHQDVQEKVRQEIDKVIGKDREPTIADRGFLQYTRAVMEEIFRFTLLVPLGVTRQCNEDTVVGGYKIPRGTYMLANLGDSSRDEKFKNPDQFDPKNFLDEKGNFVRNEMNIPFSIGKRNCVGETLARLELFIFMSMVLQKFLVYLPPEEAQRDVVVHSGLFRVLDSHKLCCKPRTVEVNGV